MIKPPIVSQEPYEEIRAKTMLPHETPSLFETVAEITSTEDTEENDYENEAGEAVNAFASPLSLWEMKTGRYISRPQNKRSLWSRIKWGVLDSVCEQNQLESRRPEGTYIDSRIGLLSSKPDMEVSDDQHNWYPMIAKNIASTMINMWKNATGEYRAPEHMIVEANHHMAATGSDRFYIAALFGGVSEKIFVIHRDEELVEEIFGAASDFWECIVADRRPKSSGSRDADVLSRIYAQIDPKSPVIDKRADPKFLAAQEEKENLSKQRSKIQKRIDELNGYMCAELEGFSSAIISDTHQVRWVFQEAKEVSFTRKPSAHLRASKISGQAAGTPINDLTQ